MAKTSPTQRSLAYLRKEGLVCAVVERWNPHAAIRQDLFNVIDIIGLVPGTSGNGSIIGVQTTTATNLAARRAKCIAEPKLRTWLQSGAFFWLHAWSKKGPRGKRKTWQLTEEELTLADLPAKNEPADPASEADRL